MHLDYSPAPHGEEEKGNPHPQAPPQGDDASERFAFGETQGQGGSQKTNPLATCTVSTASAAPTTRRVADRIADDP